MDPVLRVRLDDAHRHRHRTRATHDVQSEFLHGQRCQWRAGFDERRDLDLHGARGVVGEGFPVQPVADERWQKVGIYDGDDVPGSGHHGPAREMGLRWMDRGYGSEWEGGLAVFLLS